MSLSTGTPSPKMHAVPAAWRRAPAVQPLKAARPAKAASRPPLVSTVDASQLFRRFEQLLPEGEHAFSQLRQDFNEWCREADVTPPPPNRLSTWLKAAGLVASRRGRAKITVYAKMRRALAA